MARALVVRVVGLYGPIALASALYYWRRGKPTDSTRLTGAVLLACAWNAPTLQILNVAATQAGWWSFYAADGLFSGIPLDLYLGWIVLWGVVPVLAFPAVPVPLVAAVMAWGDLLLMPLSEPLVRLGDSWLLGETAAVILILFPGLYLARWTMSGTHLHERVVLQAIAFTGIVLLVIPTAVLEQTGGDWQPLLGRSARANNLLAQLLALPAVLGLSAVQEFVTRGGGTPIPYDPPIRMVTSGPYAYMANPMQAAAALVFLVWAVMLENGWLIGASVMTVAYSSGLAAWHEDQQLAARFGDRWTAYRSHVRVWWPRWRPFAASRLPGHEGAPARLYVAATCATCRGLDALLSARGLTDLDIVAAESYPSRDLRRLTYQPSGDGPEEEGVAAFARALEHINFAWAIIGMFMRLPIVCPILQVLADASGGSPRRISRAENAEM